VAAFVGIRTSWGAERRTSRGGQPRYSAVAITTALTLRAVFRLALRQTEGLIGSIVRLLGLALAVPDHSTLSRRAECGSGNDSSGRFYAGKRSLSLRPAASWAITCRASARGSDCRDLQIRGGVGVARAKGLWDYGPACGGPSETDGVLPPVLRANA
jgi:hypothetical protein